MENLDNVSGLLHLAVEVGFDWVHYTSSQFVRLTVIPDGECCMFVCKLFGSEGTCTLIG